MYFCEICIKIHGNVYKTRAFEQKMEKVPFQKVCLAPSSKNRSILSNSTQSQPHSAHCLLTEKGFMAVKSSLQSSSVPILI